MKFITCNIRKSVQIWTMLFKSATVSLLGACNRNWLQRITRASLQFQYQWINRRVQVVRLSCSHRYNADGSSWHATTRPTTASACIDLIPTRHDETLIELSSPEQPSSSRARLINALTWRNVLLKKSFSRISLISISISVCRTGYLQNISFTVSLSPTHLDLVNLKWLSEHCSTRILGSSSLLSDIGRMIHGTGTRNGPDTAETWSCLHRFK